MLLPHTLQFSIDPFRYSYPCIIHTHHGYLSFFFNASSFFFCKRLIYIHGGSKGFIGIALDEMVIDHMVEYFYQTNDCRMFKIDIKIMKLTVIVSLPFQINRLVIKIC